MNNNNLLIKMQAQGFTRYNQYIISTRGLELQPDKLAVLPNPDMVEICEIIIARWIDKRKTINRDGHNYNSYGLKHVFEQVSNNDTINPDRGGEDVYISNGAMIQAAVDLGFDVEACSPNSHIAAFNMSSKRLLKFVKHLESGRIIIDELRP